jgi:hypothetical protein
MVLELSLPFLKPGGLALIQKSLRQCQDEGVLASQGARKLKAQLVETSCPNREVLDRERGILIFKQMEKVPLPYPRDWPKLKKKPLF